MLTPNHARPLSVEQLEKRHLFAGDLSSATSDLPTEGDLTPLAEVRTEPQIAVNTSHQAIDDLVEDVNADGIVSPLDALSVLNALSQDSQIISGEDKQASIDEARRDVNRDGKVTPIDALLIINRMNLAEQRLLTTGCSCGGIGCPACDLPETLPADTSTEDDQPAPIMFISSDGSSGCSCGGIGCAACT